MQFLFRQLDKQDIQKVATWRYEEPYTLYNGSTISSGLMAFLYLRPLFRWIGYDCLAVDDEHGNFVGLFQFSRQWGSAITIGLAMHPDFTGKGHGLAFVQAGLAKARYLYAPTTFCLVVAAFNQRAQKVYERAGFQTIKEFTRTMPQGREAFYKMERPAFLAKDNLQGDQ